MPILQKTPAPNLPVAAKAYDFRYTEQHNNVLRLFFNRLTNSLNALLGNAGGTNLNFPYCSVSSRVNQSTSGVYTPTKCAFEVVDCVDGGATFDEVNDRVIVPANGIYNVQFSIQFQNTDTKINDAYVGLRVNGSSDAGSPAYYTGSRFAVVNSHGGVNGYTIGACNFFLDLKEGDYIELWWSAESTPVTLHTEPRTTSPYVLPGVPSVVMTCAFVSSTT